MDSRPLCQPRIMTCIKSNLNAILYLFIVALLWSIAIWDISAIIDDYINDNRYTLVKAVNLENGGAPFLEDVEICVQYRESIFQQVWNDRDFQLQDIVNEIDEEETSNNWTETINILKNFEFPNDSLQLTRRQMLHATKIIGTIYDMDEKYKSDLQCHDLPPVDKFLKHNSIQLIEKNIRDFIYDYTPNATILSNFIQTKSFALNKICNYIRVKNISRLAKENQIFEFPLPVRNMSITDASEINSKTEIEYVEIIFPNKRYKTPKIHPGQTLNIQVNIGNVGVYDISMVTPNCIGAGNISQLNDNCKDRTYIEAIQKFCGCVPFAYAVSNRLINNYKIQTRDYCTQEIYNSSRMATVHAAMDKSDCGQPCVTAKNVYDIEPQITNGGGAYGRASHDRVLVSFVITDSIYSVYEEKFRMSFPQLIAQAGGDIGIYTGFSLLALWQFLVFFYAHHRGQQKLVKTVQGRKSGNIDFYGHRIKSLFDAILCYLRGDKRDADTRKMTEMELQMRLRQIDDKLKLMTERHSKDMQTISDSIMTHSRI